MSAYTTLRFEIQERLALITLDRPEVRNAVNEQMRGELREVIAEVGASEAVRGLIITGAGSAFCSGGDIQAMRERMALGNRVSEVGWRRQRELHEILGRLYYLDKPTIAAVNGPAFGLGLDLALCCDFLFAAQTATLCASFIQRGLVPDGGGLYFLPRRVGLARAKDLILSGRVVQADEALAIGLADRVAPPDRLLEEARAWAEQLAQLPRTAQALAKNILNRSSELSLEEVNALGAEAQAICYLTPDHQESVTAFLERRGR
jgi:2-(1,2-epoxy-1,2-dihydrophenyl)acetyl-CoA isomerase